MTWNAPLPIQNQIELRDYQKAAIEAIYKYFADHDGNPLVVVPTGGGKSLIIARFVREAIEQYPGTRILVVTHVKELIAQNYAELVGIWPDAPAGVYSAGLGRRQIGAQVLFCGIQSIWKKAYDLQTVDLVLIDECFPAGTPISTPNGLRRIESLRPGDTVLHALGSGFVKATSRRSTTTLMEVTTDDGQSFRCTPNHPLFTAEGFVEAGKLEVGSYLFGEEELRMLREGVSSLQGDERASLGQATFLLDILLEEAGESHARRWSGGANGGNAEEDRTQAKDKGRQRNGADEAAGSSIEHPGRRLGGGICRAGEDANQHARGRGASEEIQDRSCERGVEDRLGGGRKFALREAIASGQGKGGLPYGRRVACVARVELASAEPVFNLQVSGHPSYFANGILAHNCHLIPASSNGTYRRFLADLLQINPYLKVIGFTATPFRLDSGMLHEGQEAVFSDIAYEVNIRELIDRGYLSPLVSRSGAREIDTASVGTRAGEFIAGQLEAAATDPETVEAIVDEIVAAGADRRGWIVFGCGVKHCTMLRDAIRERGISCESIFGDTPAGERDAIVARFKRQEIRCLSSMGVLTTGFNARHVDLIAVARPTKSTGLWIQIVGRGTRLFDGKENCLILDFGGNIDRHGPIDNPKVKRPREKGEGEEDGAPVKKCPECGVYAAIGARECPECGAPFKMAGPQITTSASNLSILSGPAPAPAWIDVDDVSYSRHTKPGKPDSLKVRYRCGLITHQEWVCFDHTGFPRRKAELWWMQRAPGVPVPTDVTAALAGADQLAAPVAISVKATGKFTEIVGYRFDDFAPRAAEAAE